MTHLTQSEAVSLLLLHFNVSPDVVTERAVEAFVAEMTPGIAEREIGDFIRFTVCREIDPGTIQIKTDRMDDSSIPCVSITVRLI